MTIRILRVLTRLAAGGPPLQSVLLTRELQRQGYETHLAIGCCTEGEKEMDYLLSPTDPVIRLRSLAAPVSLVRDVYSLFRLWWLMRRLCPHIVHTHTAKAGALGRLAALLAGVPIIVHTFHGHVLDGYFSPALSSLFRRIERFLSHFTSKICVLTTGMAEELSDKFHIAPRSKFEIVPLGADLTPYRNLPDPPDRAFTVGWLGRFAAVKDVRLLTRVIEQTLRHRLDVRFLVAGAGPDRRWIARCAEDYPRNVELLGWREDVRPVLARCHVLLQTSRREGTPLTLIQGMAARRPFVATPVGGVVDLAGDGARGICRPADARELADALLELARNPDRCREMGHRAAAYASEKFDQDRLIRDVDRLYRALLTECGITEDIAASSQAGEPA